MDVEKIIAILVALIEDQENVKQHTPFIVKSPTRRKPPDGGCDGQVRRGGNV